MQGWLCYEKYALKQVLIHNCQKQNTSRGSGDHVNKVSQTSGKSQSSSPSQQFWNISFIKQVLLTNLFLSQIHSAPSTVLFIFTFTYRPTKKTTNKQTKQKKRIHDTQLRHSTILIIITIIQPYNNNSTNNNHSTIQY